MNDNFVVRERCPGCDSSNTRTLKREGFTNSPIQRHLETFYAEIGSAVEFEYLEGAEYILNECEDCGLLYQEQVPNDFLMSKLYEEWIDADKALVRLQDDVLKPMGYVRKSFGTCS